jgi:NAD(P)-dependent dehydrogenase (short-subunit alcohol dehydrogenase family)
MEIFLMNNKIDVPSEKIVVSGNPTYGLGLAIRNKFSQAHFYSRSQNQTDLTNINEMNKFALKTLEFDIYISCSSLYKFNQTLLLEAVVKKWQEKNHIGQIIVLGSSADSPVKGTSWLYPIEKKALKAYCRNLSLTTLGGHGSKPSGFRMTYLSPGYLNTPEAELKHKEVKKIDVNYVVDIIEWIMLQPKNININEISIDPIQVD